MRRQPETARPARPGFTLIEILVVIAIIAILVSLTAAAVMRVRLKAEELKNRHNISQLSTSISAFTSKTGASFIPSMLVLREDGRYGDNANATLAAAELATERYLKALWPRMITAAKTGNPSPNSRVALPNQPGQFLDWNGNGNYETGQFFILQGDQSLVFMLGGIQVPSGSGFSCMGFCSNKVNPTNIGQFGTPVATDAPYFDFPADRLRIVGQPSATRSGFFASFLDPYDTPYLYFSCRGACGLINGYNSPLNAAAQQYTLPGATFAGDCPDSGVSPYFEPSGKPYARDGFQIISAGYDQLFGPGGIYDGSQATLVYPQIGPPSPTTVQLMPNSNVLPHTTYDDLTNFHDKILGSGNQ